MFRLAYFVTHPIQYQAPLLRHLARIPALNLQVFFCSDFSVRAHREEAFNQTFQWDVPLTEGYAWELLPRLGLGPSTSLRPFWPVTGLKRRLRQGRFDAAWVHGWGHMGLRQAVRAANALRIPVLLRGESTLDVAPPPRTWKRWLRNAFLRRLLARVAGCLCIGSLNRQFYREFGVLDDRLFLVPYAVDNAWFQAHCAAAAPQREALRRELRLEAGRPVILFAAKFIPVKAPDELLAAYLRLRERRGHGRTPYLLFVGDGPLRASLEARARTTGDDSIRFLGFRNQTELPALYDLCDVFVLPSRFEPWGLVVNEVMNAAKPVIVSDRVGAAPDLVQHGRNGFIYRQGSMEELAACLEELLESPERRCEMGRASLERISTWDFEADARGLIEALEAIKPKS